MKAFAKANIFLKIVGFNHKKFHLLQSRFVLIHEFYDELSLSKDKQNSGFEIISDFECEDNIIYKAYELLAQNGFKNELEECFKQYSLKLTKNIPVFAGLGGGSSDAATFLLLMNESLNLKIPLEKLITLSTKIGSDIPFFLSGFESANVSGIGEIVEEFCDEKVNLNFFFPNEQCSSKAVYEAFDKGKFDIERNIKKAEIYKTLPSKQLLNEKNIELNDLFTPCVLLYPKMMKFKEQNYFLSGSGSSVFKVA